MPSPFSPLVSSLARRRALVVVARVAADAVAWAFGFRAVSDDDFARVVIAQELARTPALDPSGTSWLPLPFWLNGAVMMLVGREIEVARWTAVALGIAAALLVHQAARWIVVDEDRALAGALAAIALPWSARLGVATVPELGVAACSLYAAATSIDGSPPRRRLLGGCALAAACLSRYEPWFLVIPFAVFSVRDAVRAADGSTRRTFAFATVPPLLAPGAWMLWNLHAHGDALAFVARVASYKRAVGESATGLLDTARGTAASLVAAEPELWLAVVLLLASSRIVAGKALAVPATWRRPVLLFAVAIVGLVVAGARDGAPTHHAERALLGPLLLGAVLTGAALVGAVRRIGGMRGALAFGLSAAVVVAVGHLARSWWRPIGALADREQEVFVGRQAAKATKPGERVLVEVTDYGYFAVQAGSGRPEDFIADRPLDPRWPSRPSSFDRDDIRDARARELGARVVVARRARLAGECEEPGPGRLCWARVDGPADDGADAPAP